MEVAGDAVALLCHLERPQVQFGLPDLDQVVDPGPELRLEEGLEEVVVRPLAQDVDPRRGVVARRQDEDRRRIHPGFGAHGPDQLVTAHLRHHVVADDQVGPQGPGQGETLLAVQRRVHPEGPRQGVADEMVHVRVVLDDQHQGRVVPWAAVGGRASPAPAPTGRGVIPCPSRSTAVGRSSGTGMANCTTLPGGAARGSSTTKSAPPSGASPTPRLPPWRSTSSRAMWSPRPVPPIFRVELPSS